jgi:type I restriction enzyme, S subunit
MSDREDFNLIPLSDTISFVIDNRGKTAPTEKTGIPLIATNCVNNTALYPTYENLRFVSKETYNNWFRAHPLPGDILLTLKGSQNGAVCLVPNPVDFTIAQDMVALRVNEKIMYPLFLFAALRSIDVQQQIKNLDVSGIIPHFKKSDFNKLYIPYPKMEIQKIVADLYFNLCNKINFLNRQNKTLEAIAGTLFRQWFVEEAEDVWETTTLDAHVIAFRGLSYKGNGLALAGQGIPMHNLNSVYEGGGYKYEGIKFYNGDYKERHQISAKDIVVTNTEQGHEFRLIGFPAIIPAFFGKKGLFSQHLYKLVPKEKTYLTRGFIYYLLMTSKVREQIISATNGSTVNMLAIDGLQRPKFKLPPMEKVLKFESIFQSQYNKIDLNHLQIELLNKLRDALLPKLMSGELKVSK